MFPCAGYSQTSLIGLIFRKDSHQHQIETFLSCAECLKIIHFPYPNILIPFSFLMNKQVPCVFTKHTLTFLFRVCEHKYKHKHKFYVYISVYVLMYVYVYTYVCVCMRQVFALVKLHATKRRWLILWEMVPLLSAVQTVVIPRARGGRKSLMSSSSSQSALLDHPSQVGVFYSDHLPSPEGWSGEGSVPVPMWQRGTSQGLLPAPRKTSPEGELWWQTSSCRQSRFFLPASLPGWSEMGL